MACDELEAVIAARVDLHFNVGSKDCSHIPFHLGLALPDAKSTGSDWYAHNRCGFVAAAPLQAVRVSKLIDINPRVKRLYRNNQSMY